jgi:hypothetical protein
VETAQHLEADADDSGSGDSDETEESEDEETESEDGSADELETENGNGDKSSVSLGPRVGTEPKLIRSLILKTAFSLTPKARSNTLGTLLNRALVSNTHNSLSRCPSDLHRQKACISHPQRVKRLQSSGGPLPHVPSALLTGDPKQDHGFKLQMSILPITPERRCFRTKLSEQGRRYGQS